MTSSQSSPTRRRLKTAFTTFFVAGYNVKIESFNVSNAEGWRDKFLKRIADNTFEHIYGRESLHFLDVVQQFEDEVCWEGDEDFAIYVQEAREWLPLGDGVHLKKVEN